MNEIEKMYENCNIKKIRYCEVEDECPFVFGHRCEDCDMKPKPEYYIYPPFTAEKQIELIRWLSSKYGIYIVDKYSIGFGTCIGDFCIKENFEEALAESINRLWQDLIEEEKEALRGILRA